MGLGFQAKCFKPASHRTNLDFHVLCSHSFFLSIWFAWLFGSSWDLTVPDFFPTNSQSIILITLARDHGPLLWFQWFPLTLTQLFCRDQLSIVGIPMNHPTVEWDSVPGNTKLDPFRHVSVAWDTPKQGSCGKSLKKCNKKGKHLRGFYNAIISGSIYLFWHIYPSIFLSFFPPSICINLDLSSFISIDLHWSLSIYLSIYLSFFLFVCLCLSFFLSFFLSFCSSSFSINVYLSPFIYLSI